MKSARRCRAVSFPRTSFRRLACFWLVTALCLHAGPTIVLDHTIGLGNTLNVANNDNLTFSAPGARSLTNNGTLALLSGGNFTDLILSGGPITLAGTGALTLSDNGNNRIYGSVGSEVLINAANHTISGSGQLGVNQLTLTNQGVITANQTTALVIDPGAGGVTNTGTVRATSSATLRLINGSFTNTGGTIEAQTGSFVRFEGASVSGGTLTTGGTGRLVNASSSTFTGVQIASGASFDINNNTDATFGGTITNQGTLGLLSVGNFTDLIAASGGLTLTGNGLVTLSNNGNNRIYGVTGTTTLVNQNNTIRGAGQIGVDQLSLDNRGTIEANLSGSVLTIDPSNSGALNSGSLIAVNGGILRLQNGNFTNTGGLIQAQSLSEVQLSNAAITGGTLDTPADGSIRTIASGNVFGGTLTTTSAAQLEINNNTNLTLLASGTYTHDGTIKLSSVGNFTDLIMSGGDVTLGGNGFITLSNNGNNRVYGAIGSDRLVLGSNVTLQGSGQIGVNQMGLVNQGLVRASQSSVLVIDPSTSGVSNAGTLRAEAGATLHLSGGAFTNTGAGRIEASGAAATVEFSGATITGGQLASSGAGATLRSIADSVFADITLAIGSTFQIANNTSATFNGALGNGGTIQLQSAGNFTDFIVGASGLTLNGGVVELSNNGNNRLYGVTGGTAFVNQGGTIRGAGQIGVNQMLLDNRGTIDANLVGSSLTIDPSSSDARNTGLLTASNGGILQLSSGSFDNTGGTIAPGASSRVELASAAIQGGTLGGSLHRVTSGSTLTGLNIASGTLVEVLNNTSLTLNGGIANSGTVQLLSVGNFTDLIVSASGATLSGGGIVELSNNGNNRIYGVSGSVVLNNANNTIRGSGELGANQLTLTNTGTIEANQPTALTLNLANASPFTNQGTLRATAGGSLVVVDNFTNAAAISVQSGSSVTAQGTLTQTAGSISLQGGTLAAASLALQGGVLQGAGTMNGAVSSGGTILPGAGGTGTGVGLLTFNSTLTLTPTSLLHLELGGTAAFDKVQAQSASLGGSLAVTFTAGFQAFVQATDTFTLFTTTNATGLSGAFAGLANGARFTTGDGFGSFQINYLADRFTLSNFQAIPEPSTYVLIGLGAVVLLASIRGKRRQ